LAEFDKYKHLLNNGEYASAETILSGLTFEQVTHLPSVQSHTIYDELWHTARWQNIVINDDKALYEKWKQGEVYPTAQASSQKDWDELVKEFISTLNKAIEFSRIPDKMQRNLDYGGTFSDALEILATHNAYHLGKIVAIRQFIGAWPPKD
jgi:hypothetical protein